MMKQEAATSATSQLENTPPEKEPTSLPRGQPARTGQQVKTERPFYRRKRNTLSLQSRAGDSPESPTRSQAQRGIA